MPHRNSGPVRTWLRRVSNYIGALAATRGPVASRPKSDGAKSKARPLRPGFRLIERCYATLLLFIRSCRRRLVVVLGLRIEELAGGGKCLGRGILVFLTG
jgi:hypothetical protein